MSSHILEYTKTNTLRIYLTLYFNYQDIDEAKWKFLEKQPASFHIIMMSSCIQKIYVFYYKILEYRL